MDSPQSITIEGESYSHIKTREYTPVSVYRGEGKFLRIGPKDLIIKELNLHKKLLEFNFPIPTILSEGEESGLYYYVEVSFGNTLLGDVFWQDTKEGGIIRDENFQKLLVTVGKFARAQFKSIEKKERTESFYLGLHVNDLIEELPHLKDKIIAGFEKLKIQTSLLPTVISHGDFNPYNLFEMGVIDFGSAFDAPAGYDIVSNVYHTFLFPKKGDFETTRRYKFSKSQTEEYFALIDSISVENNLPKMSDFAPDFIFARTIWSAVHMQRWPKIQEWRYKKFERILESYLGDKGDIVSITME